MTSTQLGPHIHSVIGKKDYRGGPLRNEDDDPVSGVLAARILTELSLSSALTDTPLLRTGDRNSKPLWLRS